MNINRKYQLISFDLDGTLLDNNKDITEDAKKWIKDYQKAGGCVVLSSGRKYHEIVRYAEELCMKDFERGYIISSSGMYLHDLKNEITFSFEGFSCLVAEKIISDIFLKSVATRCKIITKNKDYIVLKTFGIMCIVKNLLYLLLHKKIRITAVNEIHNIFGAIEKISVDTTDKLRVMSALNGFETRLNIRVIDENRVEIYDKNVDKSIALMKLLSKLKIDSNSLLLFGDDENDQMCFETFSNTVAMGNAINTIKDLSKYIAKRNDENGVYLFLKNI